jgi:hypothetical protein
MSYTQAMKWQRTHRKGTRQPVIMSTGSGFWPAYGWLKNDFWPYLERCKAAGIEPMECQAYYNAGLRGGAGDPRLTDAEQTEE